MTEMEKKAAADKATAEKAANEAALKHEVAKADASKKTGTPATAKDFSRPHKDVDTNAFDEGEKKDDPARPVARVNFSIADFQDIYAALRDGDYYSAFRKAIRFLDTLLNVPRVAPPRGLRPVAVSGTAVTGAEMMELDRSIALMEAQLNQSSSGSVELEDNTVRMANAQRKSGEAAKLDIKSILAIVMMVLDLVKQWRNRN